MHPSLARHGLQPVLALVHASRCSGPAWHSLPSVLVFACAGRCCSLTLGLIPAPVPLSVIWVPIGDFCGSACLGQYHPQISVQPGGYCSSTESSQQVPYRIFPQIQFCPQVGAAVHPDMVHFLLTGEYCSLSYPGMLLIPSYCVHSWWQVMLFSPSQACHVDG